MDKATLVESSRYQLRCVSDHLIVQPVSALALQSKHWSCAPRPLLHSNARALFAHRPAVCRCSFNEYWWGPVPTDGDQSTGDTFPVTNGQGLLPWVVHLRKNLFPSIRSSTAATFSRVHVWTTLEVLILEAAGAFPSSRPSNQIDKVRQQLPTQIASVLSHHF